MTLEIRIKAPPSGPDRTLTFSKSPIRIGRNQLNDISLDNPFVSEWHGTIRFDERSVAYFDLGSTNGTLLDGQRLPKNVAAELSDTSCLMLGVLELFVSRRTQESEPVVPHPQTAKPSASGPHHTLAWGRPDRGALPGGPRIVGGRTPAPASLPASAPWNAPAATTGNSSSAGTSAAHPARDAAPVAQAARPASEPDQRSARQAKLLEAFTEAFIGLRKGYEQFGAEVGVRTISGSTPLHRARSSRELLDYLLQPNVDTATTTRDLIAIFADFGIHHIAMMQGVTEGVRAMLQSLNPHANDIDTAGRLFTGAKTKHQWKAYLNRFDQMITDDNELHAAIFGSDFARAYASVTLGDTGKPSDGETD